MSPDALTAGLLAGAAVALLVPPDPAVRLSRAVAARAAEAGPVDAVPSARTRWARRSRRTGRPGRARAPGSGTPVPVVTDLVAAALLTGLPPAVAVEAVAEALDAADDPAGGALRTGDEGFAVLTEALELASATGLGPVPLVQAAASQARRVRAARSQVAARRLGTLVVLPTGLCLLPAFVLLTVAPLVLDLLLG
jgi:hypothetical protein